MDPDLLSAEGPPDTGGFLPQIAGPSEPAGGFVQLSFRGRAGHVVTGSGSVRAGSGVDEIELGTDGPLFRLVARLAATVDQVTRIPDLVLLRAAGPGGVAELNGRVRAVADGELLSRRLAPSVQMGELSMRSARVLRLIEHAARGVTPHYRALLISDRADR